MLDEAYSPLIDGYLYSVIATHADVDDTGRITWFYRDVQLISPYVGVWPQPIKRERYAA